MAGNSLLCQTNCSALRITRQHELFPCPVLITIGLPQHENASAFRGAEGVYPHPYRLLALVVAAETRHVPVVAQVDDHVRAAVDDVLPDPAQMGGRHAGLRLRVRDDQMCGRGVASWQDSQ